ncbi:hypothetical protein LPJ78_001260 [Coemansia sp. RSA 989]|nr:hypothetical protein LPJ79_001121 [Coemansia sp. RSA 1821]KAJ1867169.1 hypothetical protein LPJ78_001260 [Coemansia sp. RSA 989]KAJ2649062.1 hypothetical protein IWW40_003473 [Coemansia sp. RSA 1250]KAJ2671729.1 hypothetical protein IWW42_003188 [Coemansia sp. RSA 1085]
MADKEYTQNIKQICELLQSDPTPEVIQGLRDAFETLGKQLKAGPFLEVFEATLSSIPFSALFSLLAAPDNKLIVTVAEVTGQLLKPVTWEMVHQTFEEYIVQGLAHPHPVVKTLVLRQFLKCEDKTAPFSTHYGPNVWKCLEGPKENEATHLAKQVLIHLSDKGILMEYLLSEESVSTIKQLLAGNASQRFRVYDVVVSAIKNTDSAFEFFRQEGIMDRFLQEGDTSDVLVAMNFYELLPTLCQSSVTYEYLDSSAVFTDALAQVDLSNTEPSVTSSLLRVSILKLFSRMADAEGISPPDFYGKYAIAPKMAGLIEESDDMDLKVTAIACIGAIGNNPKALGYLAQEKTALDALAAAYKSSYGQLRVECLRAIACIFGYSLTPSGELSQTCYDLYTKLDQIQFLVAVTKEIMKGFEDTGIAGLAVIEKMVRHAWGLHEVASYRNILNFLLMRDSSREKTVQKWQYSVLETIVNAPDARKEFAEDVWTQLTQYVKDGPYYAAASAQVALGSAS